MAVKHLPGYSKEEIRDKMSIEIPIWQRKEAWKSPLALIFIAGYIIYGIGYAIFWILRFILISWMRPLTKSTWLCKLGLHRWRYLRRSQEYTYYYCECCFKGAEDADELSKCLLRQTESEKKYNYFSLWQ